MGRDPRIHIAGGLYFVTTRGSTSLKLFKDDEDCQQFLALVAKYKEQYKFKLFSYVLMPDLVHLLIEPALGTTISDIMHVINSTYTKYFNGRYERKGHVFQGRFKASIAERETCLNELLRYIHMLPVISGLADKPERYAWSSYLSYAQKAKTIPGMEADVEEALNVFSGSEEERIRLCREFTESARKEDMEQVKKKLWSSPIVGSKAFIENVKSSLKEDARKEYDEKNKVWAESAAHKFFLIGGLAAVLILLVITVFLYKANLGLASKYESALQESEDGLTKRLQQEKEKIKQDLTEKFRADKVSYEAMAKRLEIEKSKTKEMRDKISEMDKKK